MSLPRGKKLTSPFDQIRKLFQFLNLMGGFPLDEWDDRTSFRISRSSYLKLIVNFVLTNLSIILIFVIIQRGHASIDLLSDNVIFSRLDIATAYLTSAVGLVTTFFTFALFQTKRNGFQSLLKSFSDLSVMFDADYAGKKSLRQSKKWILIQALLVTCNGLSTIAFNLLSMSALLPELQSEDPMLYWSYIFSGVFLTLSGSFNPVIITADILISYLVSYLKDHFQEWRSQVEIAEAAEQDANSKCVIMKYLWWNKVAPSDCRRKVVPKTDYHGHAMLGIRLCQLVDELDHFLAPFLLWQLGLCLLGGTFAAFSVCGVFFNIGNEVKITFCVGCMFYGLYTLLKMFRVCTLGQELEDEMSRARTTFEMYMCPMMGSLDVETTFLVNILLTRLSASRGLCPKSFFNVNHNAFFGAMGAVFTYLIVLLQFRIEENRTS